LELQVTGAAFIVFCTLRDIQSEVMFDHDVIVPGARFDFVFEFPYVIPLSNYKSATVVILIDPKN
jgi:hypothetical protein